MSGPACGAVPASVFFSAAPPPPGTPECTLPAGHHGVHSWAKRDGPKREDAARSPAAWRAMYDSVAAANLALIRERDDLRALCRAAAQAIESEADHARHPIVARLRAAGGES